jgi:hypothetical protein
MQRMTSGSRGRWCWSRRGVSALSLMMLGIAAVSGCRPYMDLPASEPPIQVPLLALARDELDGLGRTLDDLARTTANGATCPPLPAGFGERLARAQKDVRWLQRQVPNWEATQAVEQLTTSIYKHRQLLAEFGPAPNAESLVIVDAVLRDVAVKARQCRQFGGPRPFNVSVVTRNFESQEVAGYEVWYVCRAYLHRPSEYRRFARQSSPAERQFDAAGYYVLWAERPVPGGQPARGTWVDVEIGEQEQQVIDIVAPLVQTTPPPADVPGAASAASASTSSESAPSSMP